MTIAIENVLIEAPNTTVICAWGENVHKSLVKS